MKISISHAFKIILTLSFTAALLLVPATGATAAGNILYAEPGGLTSGACDDWANACTLEYALGTVASSGDEIWVMKGTHTPTTGTNRSASFQLISSVGVYGGFDGTETARDQRDPAAYTTTLSGDIGTLNYSSDNSYHVVTGSGTDSTAVLDGFTITAGSANSYGIVYGGGMYNNAGSPSLNNLTFSGNLAGYGGGMANDASSSPTLTDVTFSGNSADIYGGGMYNRNNSSPTLTDVTFSDNLAHDYGGGMLNSTSSPTLTDVTFSGNSADFGGGGMYNRNNSNPTLTDVTFSDNLAHDYGGGMLNSTSSPTLTDVTFSGNSAGYDGGGMYNKDSSSPTLSNVTFSDNLADSGGGMANWSSSNPTLTDVTFSGNSTYYFGGGMLNNNNSSPTLNNVTFSGNSADSGGGMYNNNSSPSLNNVTFNGNSADFGGGMINDDSSPSLNNVTFSDNSTDYDGGGMYNYYSSSPTLNNVTFNGNTASFSGGGMYNNNSSPTLYNVILWGDSAPAGTEIFDDVASASTITDSVVQGGFAGGTNIITADPLLGPLADNGGFTQTMALNAGSSAIDTGGVNAACEDTDQRGVKRILFAPCDIGAYEAGAEILTVAASSPSTGAVLTSLTTIEVTFSEAALADGSAKAANNTANYLLVEDGANGTFDTASCDGGLQTDDTAVTLSGATYDSPTLTTTLNFSSLPAGSYRLFVCGTTSIWSAAGLELNNGASDTTVDFTISAESLPATGFAPGMVTELPAQPAEKAYASTDLVLHIPELGIEMEIVGVPLTNGEWDTSWLGNNAGWLEGSAFPTWAGNTILTGHVWDANNNPGPFANLKDLQHGDQITITAFGQTYTYEVRESSIVFPGKVDKVFQHEEYDYLTLLTCELYSPLSDNYLFRRVVRAVLIEVQ